MRKTLTVLCAMLILLPCFIFATGESESSKTKDEQVTLRFMWWGGSARHEATLKVINLYMEKHPNIKIDAEYDGGASITQQKLFTQLAGKNAADIIQVDAWWTDAQKKFNAFADLSQFPQLDRSGFSSQFVMDYGSMNGVIYALPTGVNIPLMLINRDVLDAAGIKWRDQWTWEDILLEGPKVHANNPDQFFFNLDQYTGSYYIVRAYLSQLSGNPTTIDDKYELGFTREQLVEVYSYIKKCYDLKIMQPPEDAMTYKQKSEQNPLWINGNAAVSMNWTSMLPNLKHDLANLDVAVLPIKKGSVNSGMFSRPSQLMTINNNSKYKNEAADFLNFFFNDPEAIAILKDVRSIPPTVGAIAYCNENNLLDPLIVKAANNAANKAQVIDSVLAQDVICLDLLYNEYENVAFGKTTPAQSADSLMQGLLSRIKEIQGSR